MIEVDFYTALSSPAAIRALVSDRIFPLVVPDESDLPAIDYSFVGGSDTPTFDTPGTAKYRVEVNCWGADYLSAITLRSAVTRALNGYVGPNLYIRRISPRDFFDHELLQYRAMVELYLFASI